MELAARFRRPILCFIDTTGAYPGVDAEERGQAEAIAKNLEVMSALPVPIVAAVIGEGGSGGALALGVADRILMLEYAVYSVISPEGCASILWRDDDKKGEAAAAMKMTARDLQRLGVVDEVVPEAPGGAHRDFDATAAQPGRGPPAPPGRAVGAAARAAASSCATRSSGPWAPSSSRADRARRRDDESRRERIPPPRNQALDQPRRRGDPRPAISRCSTTASCRWSTTWAPTPTSSAPPGSATATAPASCSKTRGLIRYLRRHKHTTPSEMVELKFHCCMPIFIARQWIRHRTANVNEYSGRYSLIPMLFYTPPAEQLQTQSRAQQPGAQRRRRWPATWRAEAAAALARDPRQRAAEHLRVADRQRRRPRAGAHRSAAVDLHPVVLEDRSAQPAALSHPAGRPPRAVGDPGVRPGDGRHAQAGGAAVLRGLDRLRRLRRAAVAHGAGRAAFALVSADGRGRPAARGRAASAAPGPAGRRPVHARGRTSCWRSCSRASAPDFELDLAQRAARPSTSPSASPQAVPGADAAASEALSRPARPGQHPGGAAAGSVAVARCRSGSGWTCRVLGGRARVVRGAPIGLVARAAGGVGLSAPSRGIPSCRHSGAGGCLG